MKRFALTIQTGPCFKRRYCVRFRLSSLGTRFARLSPRSLWVARPSLRSAVTPHFKDKTWTSKDPTERAGDKNGIWILSFTFRYGNFEFDYMGRYYAFVYEGNCDNTDSEDEYGWSCYAEMLDATITQTGKTVREMLAELPEHDLEITFDSPSLPDNAVVVNEV